MFTEIPSLDDKSFNEIVNDDTKPIVIIFYAEWSGNCQLIESTVCRYADQFQREISFYKIDTEVNFTVTAEYGIKELPTLLFFKNGWLRDRVKGTANKNELLKRLLQFVTKEIPIILDLNDDTISMTIN